MNSYALRRWTQVTGILQEKEYGLTHIKRIRTLHIIESELNFFMRLVWFRELMKWSESHQAININQYGGRKGVQAQSAALNKTLTLIIIRFYAYPSFIIDNGAQACYYRILVIILCYTLLRLGMPVHLIHFL